MASEAVPPLRIAKNSQLTPSKTSGATGARPLAEINPMGIRRNSGGTNSQNQSPKSPVNRESSPFEPSPSSNSKLQFWKDRDALSSNRIGNENVPFKDSSPSANRRTSLEHLKKVSRVTTNNIFVRQGEQATDSQVKPNTQSRSTRPLSAISEYSSNAKGPTPEGPRMQRPGFSPRQQTLAGESRIPWLSPNKTPAWSPPKFGAASKIGENLQSSPWAGKSSIASKPPTPRELETPTDDTTAVQNLSTTPRPMLRQAKSVSFDIAPPQINEYEMITPDPSSVASGSREGSVEADFYDEEDEEHYEHQKPSWDNDSFDDSLADAGKTPVVLPEDWRFMMPEAANKELAANFEDPFDEAQDNINDLQPQRKSSGRSVPLSRSDSVLSNGERRPLPPLPRASPTTTPRKTSDVVIATSSSSPHRSLFLSPYAISASREDSTTLNETEHSTLISNNDHMPSSTIHESDLSILHDVKSAAAKDTGLDKAPAFVADIKEFPQEEKWLPLSHVSKDSTPTKIESKGYSMSSLYSGEGYGDEDYEYDDEYNYNNIDPHVPIPLRETSGDLTAVLQQPNNDVKTLEPDHNIYQFEDQAQSESLNTLSENDSQNGNVTQVIAGPADIASIREAVVLETHEDTQVHGGVLVTQHDQAKHNEISSATSTQPSHALYSTFDLPDIVSVRGANDFSLGLNSYLNPTLSAEADKACSSEEPTKSTTILAKSQTAVDEQENASEQASQSDRSGTPESVIHYMTDDSDELHETAIIPEQIATIKAAGTNLKTRPSATPADIRPMAAARRELSDDKPLPLAPSEEYDSEDEGDEEVWEVMAAYQHSIPEIPREVMTLNVPIDTLAEHGGLGLDEAFNRVVETQKRGYVMRQNDNVIIASNRQVSDDKSSVSSADVNSSNEHKTRAPKVVHRKPSGNTWKAEPWNGKVRRGSRQSSIMPEGRLNRGPIPPLPGQESAVSSALESVVEDIYLHEEGGERGRLFVKVVQLKELDLPMPRDERCQFVLTLDNGLHCVTTNWAELGRTAPIGQEFELVVFDDLEFQLTLQTRLQRPQSVSGAESVDMASSTRSMRLGKASSKLGKFLRDISPKKRHEREQRERQEADASNQRQHEQEMQRVSKRPTAWDMQHQLVGEDGSFARSYVSLSNFEQQAFGRPYTVDVPCFNEWAVEDKNIISSTRSKMGGIQRRPPYRIGKLELQLLFIPRPKGVADDDMPRSISAAVRQLKEAESVKEVYFEGHLSQQGGDCPYWRRRFFKMQGPTLTAYHETTRQVRATISLARATHLIDDRSSLTQLEITESNTKRRKSAFAHDEEGFLFVEEGFRIRFANGESIDFYADSTALKEQWMRALSQVVGKDGATGANGKVVWTSAVLQKERALISKSKQGQKQQHPVQENASPLRGGSRSAPTSPRKPLPASSAAAAAAYMAERQASRASQQSQTQAHSQGPPKPHHAPPAPPSASVHHHHHQREEQQHQQPNHSNMPYPARDGDVAQPQMPGSLGRLRGMRRGDVKSMIF